MTVIAIGRTSSELRARLEPSPDGPPDGPPDRPRYEVLAADPSAGNLAAALNEAVASASADLVLFLAGDSEPTAALLAAHVAAHADAAGDVAIRGVDREVRIDRSLPLEARDGLPLTPLAPRPPLDASTLLSGERHDGSAFALGNLSVARRLLGATPFDVDRYPDGVGAALDLGHRLGAEGVELLFRADLVASPELDRFDLEAWLELRVRRGIGVARLCRRQGLTSVLGSDAGTEAQLTTELQQRAERSLAGVLRAVDEVQRRGLERLSGAARRRALRIVRDAGDLAFERGLLTAWTGGDPWAVVRDGPPRGRLTSIVVVTYDNREMTRRCIERLRRFREPNHPIEIVAVDNGSQDGTREWLAAQDDIVLHANPANRGAPIARNQALGVARGAYIAFLDSDAMVSEGWLGRLLYHLEIDPGSGFVGPVTDRASHGQKLADAPAEANAIDAFARRRADQHARAHRSNVLMSSFCILARRTLLDDLGGFDPRFSPWGFEDDDMTFRSHLSGRRNRVALDVFVQHLPYQGRGKKSRHDGLLDRNWRRFAGKWGLPPDTPYGHGIEHLEALARTASLAPESLRVPLDAAEPTGAAATASVVPSPRPCRPQPTAAAARAPIEPRVELGGRQLSVIVPTYGRPDRVRELLGHLDRQTLEPAAFEVIIVDDGSEEPITVDPGAHAFALVLLRQDNRGPAAARNLAIAHCRAPTTLILNDDAVPAPDNLAVHLGAHATESVDTAILGTFDFTPEVRREAFPRLLDGTSLLFDYATMRDGQRYGWQYFWTCNVSLETALLRAVGGFDEERFCEPICEDVELGYRLEQRGVSTRFHAAARCGHQHSLTSAAYFRRAVRLGAHLARMYEKHGDPEILSWRGRPVTGDNQLALQIACEGQLEGAHRDLDAVRQFEENGDEASDSQSIDALRERVRAAASTLTMAGILLETGGADPAAAAFAPPEVEMVSIVIMPPARPGAGSGDAIARERPAVVASEVIAVGAPVAAQGDDVHAIAVEDGESRAAAVNRAIARARGASVLLVAADTHVGPGWLDRLLYHAVADGRVGCVGVLTPRGELGEAPDDLPPGLNAGSAAAFVATGRWRQFRYQRLLGNGCLLVRKDLLARLGGLDPRVPSDLALTDLSLRSHLLGARNRLARDVLVEPSPRDDDAPAAWQRWLARWRLDGVRPGDYAALVTSLERRAPAPAELTVPSAADSGQAAATTRDPDPGRPRLSLCVIARDESETIERCLASAAPWVDEMVVVDTGSTDDTAVIAERAGARVRHEPWQDDFAHARNRALDHARGEWVLSLDADEVVADGTGASLRARIDAAVAGGGDAYMVKIRNRHDRAGVEESFTSWAPRLFRRSDLRWRGTIHEQLARADGAPLKIEHDDSLVLDHDGYLAASMERKGKAERNRRLLLDAIQRAPTEPLHCYHLGQELYTAGEYTEALAWLQKALELLRTREAVDYAPYVYALATGACVEVGETERGVLIGEEGSAEHTYADLLCNLAACYAAEGRTGRAEETYKEARALAGVATTLAGDDGSATWRPLQGLALIASRRGDHEQACAHYDEALAYAPERPALNVLAGQAALATGATAIAEERFAATLATAPAHEEAQLGAVDCLIVRGQADEALESLTDLIVAEPDRLPTRIRLAELMAAAGHDQAALEVLAPAIGQEPPSGPLYTVLGELLQRLERHEEAFNAFVLAVSTDPTNGVAIAGMQAAYEQLQTTGAGSVRA